MKAIIKPQENMMLPPGVSLLGDFCDEMSKGMSMPEGPARLAELKRLLCMNQFLYRTLIFIRENLPTTLKEVNDAADARLKALQKLADDLPSVDLDVNALFKKLGRRDR